VGYVNRSSESEPRDFADQFEWDGHSWLFRRFHRARPVRVSAEEMDQSIDFYATWSKQITVGAVVLSIALVILWDVVGPDDGPLSGRPVEGLGLLLVGALTWAARNWVWRRATDRFSRRVPVGLSQSWLEDRQEQVEETAWANLLAPIAILAVATYFLWPLSEARWFEFAMAAIAGLAALLDLVLKLRARRL
jgi:hypothetical protein